MPYIIAVLAIAVIGIGFTFFQSNKTIVPSVEVSTKSTTTPQDSEIAVGKEIEVPTSPPAATTNSYKDGAHATTVTYLTPIKAEYMLEVSLTLANDIVTDAQIVYSNGAEKDPNAQRFETAYRTEVIGKDIDSLNLSRVGGASLTTGAFNNALTAIKTEAKS